MPVHASFTSNVRLAELARTQRGLLTRAELADEGISDSTIVRWVASEVLVPVFPRVFRHAAVPETWEQRVLAACLSGGEGTVASHRSAGALWGLDNCRPGVLPNGTSGSVDKAEVSPIEILTTRRLRSPMLMCTRTQQIPPLDVKHVRGIPATSVERTLIDLAEVFHKDHQRSRWTRLCAVI